MGYDSNAGAGAVCGYIKDSTWTRDKPKYSYACDSDDSVFSGDFKSLLLHILLPLLAFIGSPFTLLIYLVEMSIEVLFELTDELSTSLPSSPSSPSSSSSLAWSNLQSQRSPSPSLSLLSLPRDPKFQIEQLPIGYTVNSSTYRGKYNGSLVCVKVWRGACGNSESSREDRRRFRQHLEQPLLSWLNLNHPNISPLHGLMFAFGKLPAVVTPYYENGDINRYVERNPGVDVRKLFEMVAAGLTYMHSLNPPVSHGDVRGCNILITSSGTPVLTEIGTSHLPSPPDWTIGSDDGTRWMAPELMNPELAPREIDDEEVEDAPRLWTTPMSDVYSFGMTMLEVCTGRVPFSHKRFYGGVIFDVVNGIRPPRPSPSAHPLLTDEIWEIIQTCWEQKPKHRPTMGCVRAWLRSIQSWDSRQRC